MKRVEQAADAVRLDVLYTEASHSALAQRRSGGWQTLALVDPRRRDLGQQVERAQRFGAHGLWLRSEQGWTAPELSEVTVAADGLPLVLSAGVAEPDLVAGLLAAAERVELSWDPIASGMRHDDWDNVEGALGATAGLLERAAPDLPMLSCSSLALHAAGGDPVDELALLAASLLEFERRLKSDFNVATIVARTWFQMAVGPELLIEIAKFRAAREVLARLFVARGLDAGRTPMILQAVTSARTLTAAAHRNNALRATGQAVAAVLGGADRLTVLPWDDRLQRTSGSAERLALQTQNVLRDEARLAEVADVGSGSFAVEHLTGQLGRAAWELLAEVEDEGGAVASLRDGTLRRRLVKVRERRKLQLTTGEQAVLGISVHADPDTEGPVHEPSGTGPWTPFFDEDECEKEGAA